MKAGNILVLFASLLLICTQEIFGTPVQNRQNLLQLRSVANEVEKIANSRSLIDLLNPELLSYIEENKQKIDLEEPSAKEVRASEPDSELSEENELKSLSLSDLADPDLLSYLEDQEQKLEGSKTEEVREIKPHKKNCKGAVKKPTTTKMPEKPTPKPCKGKKPVVEKKPLPPKIHKPLHLKPIRLDRFQSFNRPPVINRECLMGDLLMSPEECISFLNKK